MYVHIRQLGVPNVYAINNGNFDLDNSSPKIVFPMVDEITDLWLMDQKLMKILDRSITNVFINYKSLNPITRQISENSLPYHAYNVSIISNVPCFSDYSKYGNECVFTDSTEKFATVYDISNKLLVIWLCN